VSRVLRATRHSIGHLRKGLSRQNACTHNNETKTLTFTQSLTYMRHKTQKQPKPKIVRTVNPDCAYVTNNNGSSNNLPSYAPDSHQCQSAVDWRTRGKHFQVVI